MVLQNTTQRTIRISYLTPSNQFQFQEAFKNQDLNTRWNGKVLSLNEVIHIESFFGQEETDKDGKVVVTEELLTLSHIFQAQAVGYLTGWVNSGKVSGKVREHYSGLWNKLSHQTLQETSTCCSMVGDTFYDLRKENLRRNVNWVQ